jgi:hypothetical protein
MYCFRHTDSLHLPKVVGELMMITAGIGILIGAALGLHFNVFVLIPSVVVALVGTAAIGIARGGLTESMALALVVFTAALQVGYLVGSIIRAAVSELVRPGSNREPAQAFAVKRKPGMFKLLLDIQEHMEVVGSDGNHVGTIDRKEIDRVILTEDDRAAGGARHLISIDWVDYVDSRVHLNKPSAKVLSELQMAACR